MQTPPSAAATRREPLPKFGTSRSHFRLDSGSRAPSPPLPSEALGRLGFAAIFDFLLFHKHQAKSLRLPRLSPAPAAALRSPQRLRLPTAAPTQSARTTSPSAPARGLNPPDIFGAILLLCCYFARDPRVIPAREGGVHCRADGRAHLAAPRPPEERHKAQARALPHRGAADREGRRGRACAWAGRGGGAGRGGSGARAGAPRPQVHLPHLPGDPRVPAPFLPPRCPPTRLGGGAAGALIGSGGSGRREQWPPPPVKRERLPGPGTGTRVQGAEPGRAAAGATRVA